MNILPGIEVPTTIKAACLKLNLNPGQMIQTCFIIISYYMKTVSYMLDFKWVLEWRYN